MGFTVDKVALRHVFLRALRLFPASVIPHMFQTHSIIILRLYIHLAVDTHGQITHYVVRCVSSASAWLRLLLFVGIIILMDRM